MLGKGIVMREKDEKLYVGRFYLFDIIPLWKVKMTKEEWQEEAFFRSSKKKIIECVFIDEEEEDDREI